MDNKTTHVASAEFINKLAVRNNVPIQTVMHLQNMNDTLCMYKTLFLYNSNTGNFPIPNVRYNDKSIVYEFDNSINKDTLMSCVGKNYKSKFVINENNSGNITIKTTKE